MTTLASSSQKALAALWRLADGSGRVSVSRRSDLLKASRVTRGSWDRAVKALVESGLVRVEVPTSRREPSVYVLTTQRGRATTSHKTSHNEPRTDVVLSSLESETKDQRQEAGARVGTSHEPHGNEPQPALLILVARLADSWERMADAQERLAIAAEKEPERAKSHGPQGEAPSCKCGPMVVRTKGGTSEQFWGCAAYPNGCGCPTIPLRSTSALAEVSSGSSGFRFNGRNVTQERLERERAAQEGRSA